MIWYHLYLKSNWEFWIFCLKFHAPWISHRSFFECYLTDEIRSGIWSKNSRITGICRIHHRITPSTVFHRFAGQRGRNNEALLKNSIVILWNRSFPRFVTWFSTIPGRQITNENLAEASSQIIPSANFSIYWKLGREQTRINPGGGTTP